MAFREWRIVKVVGNIAMRIWAASGAVLLIFVMIYCFYGGMFAFTLLLFATSGDIKKKINSHEQNLTI